MPHKLLEILVKKISRGKAVLTTENSATEFELPLEILPPAIAVDEKLNFKILESSHDRDDTAREMLEEIIN